MAPAKEDWLIGSKGVYHGTFGGPWTRIGPQEFGASSLIRQPDRLVAGASLGSGLWQWTQTGNWKQLHDETLTEVTAIAPIGGDPGLIAGSPYGIALGQYDDLDAVRWTHLSDELTPNERFTNALLVDPADADRWLVGTEAGILIARNSGTHWQRTNLLDTPVRALTYAHDRFWAGTDQRGIWHSPNGLDWTDGGQTQDGGAIYDLAASSNAILAATEHGVAIGDRTGNWQRLGPRFLCAAIAVHPQQEDLWLAGATPGGLWQSEDAGDQWQQVEGFVHVQTILPPQGA